MSYTEADVTSRQFRDDLAEHLDDVQHRGIRKLITRKGKPAAFVASVGDLVEFDRFRATERGLSHVSWEQGSESGTYTRDELAAKLVREADQLAIGEGTVELRLADLDMISTLLGELGCARDDALARLADDWSSRLHNIVADAEQ